MEFGQQVTVRNDQGKYLAILPANPQQGLPAKVGLSNTAYTWDVSGYKSSGLVRINDPVALSVPAGSSRTVLSVSKDAGPQGSQAITIGFKTVASSSKTPPSPPANTTYVWRVLGPGPDIPTQCDSFSERCGNICCGPAQMCVNRVCG